MEFQNTDNEIFKKNNNLYAKLMTEIDQEENYSPKV